MIFKSFLLGNLVSLCMKIINSVVVVGLYYGFLTTFSIGPSYLFLLRAQVMEEGTQKKVSATTGFITGQLMMFISIYYAPLHLALGRPHTITVLALPYLLFHFFWNNHKHFFDYGYGSTTRNSMRNLSIQCVFLNNLIFQLFNHFILPSSMLARLVNIYMFRCNNKMLFVTSSFVGWLIGHILFMKWVGLVLVWIPQNNSIRSIVLVLIRSNKYLVSEVRDSMARIVSILLFITCVYYLGRIPSPILTKKLNETSETEETDVEIETTSETKGTKEEQEGSTEEDPSPSPFSEEKEDPDKIDETEEIRVNGTDKTKDEFHFHFNEKNSPVYETSDLDGNQENSKLEILKNKEIDTTNLNLEKKTKKQSKTKEKAEKPLVIVTRLFDYKRWNRPLRYIKNDQFEKAVRNEMSQYFFYTCRSDGNQKISFTYPPSLSTFGEIIKKRGGLYTTETPFSYELYNQWVRTNEQKENNLSTEFISRLEALDKGFLPMYVLEKRARLCNDQIKKEYLSKKYDPFLNGPYRGTIHFFFFFSILNKPSIENSMGPLWINKIHGMFFVPEYGKFDQKMDAFNLKPNEFSGESRSYLNCKVLSLLFPERKKKKNYSKDQAEFFKFLFNAVLTDPNDQTIRKKYLGVRIKEISKKLPRWSYKLINDLEQQEIENDEGLAEEPQIRSRKTKRVIIFNDNQHNSDINTPDIDNSDQTEEVTLLRYSEQSDFRRDIIKGSMRTQRRKIATFKLFQANIHSPLFLDRIENSLLFAFDISKRMQFFFIKRIGKNTELKISDYTGEGTKERGKKEVDKREKDKMQEKARIEIAEVWDTILLGQVLRGLILVTQSILRKYLLLPSFIIAKNIGRILLFDFPEWSEDFKDWKKERHLKCTYNGVQLSEKEFPKNWLTEGIQIKILFPFRLKPWHRSKPDSVYIEKKKKNGNKYDFCFLTVWGKEAELPFCSSRRRPSFFGPIFKELGKIIIKRKTNCFPVLRSLNERTNFSLIVSTEIKEIKKRIVKSILFIQRIIKELSKKKPILLFGLGEVYEFSETKKDLIISNSIIYESSSEIQSIDWTNSSLTEKKIKGLTDRTSLIITQIVKIRKTKKIKYLTPEINICSNKKNHDAKRLESQKSFWQMLKRRNTRLIRKSHFFIKFFFQRIYMGIFISNIPRINTQVFLESTTKSVDKYIYNINIEANQESIEKKNMNFSFRKALSNISQINKNSQNLSSLSLSQAYVFYKLSKTHVINLRSILQYFQYYGTSVFIKNELKGYFVAQRIFRSELKQKKLTNSRRNQWKNWLRVDDQYHLSKIQWSKLVAQKWSNRIKQGWITPNKDLNKRYSYEKYQVIHYEKATNYTLPNQQENFKKHYEYGLLSSKSINSEDNKNSYSYVSPFQVNTISYNYNIDKHKFFDPLGIIPIQNYVVKDTIIDMAKNPDRKYLDWKMLSFCFRKKLNIETWIHSTNNKKTNHDQKVDKIDKKDLFYLTLHEEINLFNKKKKRFDWMGMNEELQNDPIANLAPWFFPEFMLLYNSYKMKPRVIPIKLLLFELENRTKTEQESPTQGNLGSYAQNRRNRGLFLSNQQKYVEEYYAGSGIQKDRRNKQYTSNTEVELDFFLKPSLHLLIQLRCNDFFNQRVIHNIKVYCLLLRLRNPKEISISFMQRGEMILDILLGQKDITLTQLAKSGILIIEPVRLSMKKNGKFIMYQTISISLVHKSKDLINQRYQEKIYVDKKNFDKSIARHQKITGTRDKNHYALLVPETILSPRRRREFRSLICFNSRKGNGRERNIVLCDGKNLKNCGKFLDTSTNLDIDKKKLIKVKLFLWPTYRLEDLACINRYWFDTTTGSSFSMVRIHMYPQF
nr:Ycf1 protein [Saxifraga geifolia (nom. illeg.)]